MNKNGKFALAIVAFLVVSYGLYSVLGKSDDESASSSSLVEDMTSSQVPSTLDNKGQDIAPATTPSTQNNGSSQTFKETVSYNVPKGDQNTLEVNLTVDASGTITDISTINNYSDDESKEYVDGFKAQISSKVKGKKLSGLSLSRVGGASLTTAAFNRVIASMN